MLHAHLPACRSTWLSSMSSPLTHLHGCVYRPGVVRLTSAEVHIDAQEPIHLDDAQARCALRIAHQPAYGVLQMVRQQKTQHLADSLRPLFRVILPIDG